MRTAFLSSTGADLKEHRERVYRAISALDGWKCIRMEDFGARDGDVDSFCRDRVLACDLFIGLIGHRFGGSPPGSKESYTQREYAAAEAAGRPRLIFLAPDDFPIPAKLREPDWKLDAQGSFPDRISPDRLPDTFTTPDDLATRVTAAIRQSPRPDSAPP